MKQIFLKFPDEKTANKVLADLYIGEGEEKTLKDPINYAIDIIGVMYESQETSIDEENPKPPIALDGWHVNMLVPDNFESEYQINPTMPRRIFSGWGN